MLLLEGAPPFKGFNPDGYSNRVSAVNNNTKKLMSSLGAWDLITSIRHKPVKRMQVWDGTSDALISFNDDNYNTEVCYIVENDLILHSVLEKLETASTKNVTIQNNSKIQSCELPKNNNTSKSLVTLKNGENFSCDLLVSEIRIFLCFVFIRNFNIKSRHVMSCLFEVVPLIQTNP